MVAGFFVSTFAGKTGVYGEVEEAHINDWCRSAAPADDIPAQIQKLAALKEQGILTEDEFAAKKAELLAKMWSDHLSIRDAVILHRGMGVTRFMCCELK